MTYDTFMLYAGLAGVAFVWARHIVRMEHSRRLHAERTDAMIRMLRPPMPPGPPLRSKLVGHSAPTMPRPSHTARCQWCRVKLTNGECVDGCGGHQ